MTSKERVVSALHCALPLGERVPVNYMANAGIDARLKAHFGLEAGDDEGLRKALGVDFRGVGAGYTGSKLHADIPERGILVDDWGIRRRWVEHPSGGYWDYCDFPLMHATEEEVAAWPMPSPDDFDYSHVADACREYAPYGVGAGNAGLGDVINGTSMLRGMEQFLVDLVTGDPAGLLLAKRRCGILLEILSRTLEAAKGGVDFVWMGEDLGTQIGPMISLDLYRERIRPLHQPFIDCAKSHGLPVMVHTCGSSSWVYEDFIEMGVDAVDTLQPEAVHMSPEYLRDHFGGRLAFHGAISTAGPVATGTVAETIADCRRTLGILAPTGGYLFSPAHMLQDNSPTENVLALYETAREWRG
jgi:uroporphyrinogen decarboxylase